MYFSFQPCVLHSCILFIYSNLFKRPNSVRWILSLALLSFEMWSRVDWYRFRHNSTRQFSCEEVRTDEWMFMRLILEPCTEVCQHFLSLVEIEQQYGTLFMKTYERFCSHLERNKLNICPREKYSNRNSGRIKIRTFYMSCILYVRFAE
jgi:hypothetical protein